MSRIQHPEKSKYFEPLAVAVASGQSVKSADVKCSLNHRYDISRTPAFKRRVAELRSATMEQSSAALSQATIAAVATLEDCMKDAERTPEWVAVARVRIAAAKSVLVSVLPMAEQTELRRRLDELESQR